MSIFENTGFVNFPDLNSQNIIPLKSSRTLVYLVAMDFESDTFSKVKILIENGLVVDDLTPKNHLDTTKLSVSQIMEAIKKQKGFNFDLTNHLISSVLIGWSSFGYSPQNDIQPWICSFRNLSNEGRKLYYSFKKLHYDKEVRLLTFRIQN